MDGGQNEAVPPVSREGIDADLLTLRRLLTTHVRADRFTEGHLAAELENGHICAILEQLEELRNELD